MEKITRDLKVSGIYCIENKINNKTYIGSSKNLYQRLLKHFALLRHNKHENAHLQSAWNKYGEESFEWFILELCDKSSYHHLKLNLTNKIPNIIIIGTALL